MNSGPLVPPLPESEGQRMDPTGACRVMFLSKLQRLEWPGRGQRKNYSSKTDFETRKDNQYFEGQSISMSWQLLDSTPFGTNTTNGIKSPIDLIPVGKKNRPYATNTTNILSNTTNRFIRAKSRSARTSRPIVRPIIEQIWFSEWYQPSKSNKKKHDKNKSFGNTRDRTSSDLIHKTTVTRYASDIKRRATRKMTR